MAILFYSRCFYGTCSCAIRHRGLNNSIWETTARKNAINNDRNHPGASYYLAPPQQNTYVVSMVRNGSTEKKWAFRLYVAPNFVPASRKLCRFFLFFLLLNASICGECDGDYVLFCFLENEKDEYEKPLTGDSRSSERLRWGTMSGVFLWDSKPIIMSWTYSRVFTVTRDGSVTCHSRWLRATAFICLWPAIPWGTSRWLTALDYNLTRRW